MPVLIPAAGKKAAPAPSTTAAKAPAAAPGPTATGPVKSTPAAATTASPADGAATWRVFLMFHDEFGCDPLSSIADCVPLFVRGVQMTMMACLPSSLWGRRLWLLLPRLPRPKPQHQHHQRQRQEVPRSQRRQLQPQQRLRMVRCHAALVHVYHGPW
jgi:hypothetical protein